MSEETPVTRTMELSSTHGTVTLQTTYTGTYSEPERGVDWLMEQLSKCVEAYFSRLDQGRPLQTDTKVYSSTNNTVLNGQTLDLTITVVTSGMTTVQVVHLVNLVKTLSDRLGTTLLDPDALTECVAMLLLVYGVPILDFVTGHGSATSAP